MIARIGNPTRWTVVPPNEVFKNIDAKPTGQQLGVGGSNEKEILHSTFGKVPVEPAVRCPLGPKRSWRTISSSIPAWAGVPEITALKAEQRQLRADLVSNVSGLKRATSKQG